MSANAAFWTAIITAIGASVSALILGVVTLILNYLRDVRAMEALKRMDAESKETLGRMEKTGHKTFKLTNSALLAIQRELAAEKWKTARRPGATADDVRAAEAADRIVAEHEVNQKELDDADKKTAPR